MLNLLGISEHLKVKAIWGQYTEKMMVMAGIDGYFTNHGLRHTTDTKLFDKDVEEQLIQEQNGHNSVAVHHYKRPNLRLKEHVSDLLNVLPQGVEKEGPTQVNSTVSKAPLDSQNTSRKEKEKDDDLYVNAKSVVKPVDINVQVPPRVKNLGNLSGLINIHFYFK